jgi:hypothetical protein
MAMVGTRLLSTDSIAKVTPSQKRTFDYPQDSGLGPISV